MGIYPVFDFWLSYNSTVENVCICASVYLHLCTFTYSIFLSIRVTTGELVPTWLWENLNWLWKIMNWLVYFLTYMYTLVCECVCLCVCVGINLLMLPLKFSFSFDSLLNYVIISGKILMFTVSVVKEPLHLMQLKCITCLNYCYTTEYAEYQSNLLSQRCMCVQWCSYPGGHGELKAGMPYDCNCTKG